MDSVSSFSVHRPDVILFSVQVVSIFVVVCVSLANLTLYEKNIELWIMMITSILGYLMPNPKFKRVKHQPIPQSEPIQDLFKVNVKPTTSEPVGNKE
jgi:hypothetical protein